MNHQDSRADALELLAETGVRYVSGYAPVLHHLAQGEQLRPDVQDLLRQAEGWT